MEIPAARIPGSLPELFAGYARQDVAVPAAYPAACSPQAWAAASPLMWLRAILRLDPIVARGQMHLAPVLPPGVSRLHVDGIRVGERRISIHVDGDDVTVEGAEGRRCPPCSTGLRADRTQGRSSRGRTLAREAAGIA